MRLVLLGPPGAGKGTQAKKIIKDWKVVHISTGDLFRANIKNETELGKKVKAYLDQGQLVPDELTIALLWDRLDREDTENGYILDGFPRTLAQAKALNEGLKERGQALDGALALVVPFDVLVPRLAGRRVCPECGASFHIKEQPPKKEGVCDLCGHELIQRDDDRESTVAQRIRVYEDSTAPLLDYYRSQGKLIEVDGNQPVDRVSDDVQKALQEIQ